MNSITYRNRRLTTTMAVYRPSSEYYIFRVTLILINSCLLYHLTQLDNITSRKIFLGKTVREKLRE